MGLTEMDRRSSPLWERILGLLEEDLAERRAKTLVVRVENELGSSYEKEVGELSAAERGSLKPALRERAVELLLDRYLAQQGRVDLLDGRRPRTKKIEDLGPADVPALVKADRWRTEEDREERKRAKSAEDVRADLDRPREKGIVSRPAHEVY